MRKVEVRERKSSTGATIATILVGAVAGFAAGMYVAQRVGGFAGIVAKLRPRRRSGEARANPYLEAAGDGFVDEDRTAKDELDEEDFDEVAAEDEEDFDEVAADDIEDATADDIEDATTDGEAPVLEERVLEAFNNDPILAERAIDIGSVGPGDIELEGWVDDDSEAEHAVTLARGVPGVKSVANRLMVDVQE